MRIVSGLYGGRVITAPKTSATRPMTDKARAALFDSLGSLGGSIVLDTYAGSGAVGLEALSRGAVQVIALESAHGAAETIRANLQDLDIAWGYWLYEMTVESWAAKQAATNVQRFNLIIADPPYDQLKPDVLEKLGTLLAEDGVLVVSHSSRSGELKLTGLQLINSKQYGDTALGFYKAA